jgi:hypothetical protein
MSIADSLATESSWEVHSDSRMDELPPLPALIAPSALCADAGVRQDTASATVAELRAKFDAGAPVDAQPALARPLRPAFSIGDAQSPAVIPTPAASGTGPGPAPHLELARPTVVQAQQVPTAGTNPQFGQPPAPQPPVVHSSWGQPLAQTATVLQQGWGQPLAPSTALQQALGQAMVAAAPQQGLGQALGPSAAVPQQAPVQAMVAAVPQQGLG